MKLNCWEVKQCGREPNGKNTNAYGTCPAAIEEKADGINSGINGGRACWALAGTFCDEGIQESFSLKFGNCINCTFYNLVLEEEGENFVPSLEIHELIKENIDNSTTIFLEDLA